MRGANPIRPPEAGDGSVLYVKHIFPTLQGEGPYAGWPAVFIRLGGCNLACGFCDTDFEGFEAWGVEEILNAVIPAKAAHFALPHRERAGVGALASETLPTCPHPNPPPMGGGNTIAVITGGEPFRQPIGPLCEALVAAGFRVQIETNGTLYRSLPPEVEIVCSPKNTGAGYAPLRPDLLERLTALKFLISAHDAAYVKVAEVGQSAYAIPVYVQPMDEYDDAMNQENLALATRLALEHGYRLSLQMHKIIGVE